MRLAHLPGVFKPLSDSWELARHIDREPVPADGAFLDLCTGSGLLAVRGAMRGFARVTAIDVSRAAVLSARVNARLNGVTLTALRGDLFAPVGDGRFDLIVSNPPYLPTARDELPSRGPERAWDAGVRGRAILDRICREAAAHLRPGGVLLLVHSSVCGEHETLTALQEHGLQTSVVFRELGPLGPRLRARADLLRQNGLLTADGCEEILVFRAQRP